jgi:PAS domain-containing protein
MKPNFNSPFWIGGTLLLTVLFSVGNALVILSVNGRLDEGSNNAALISRLNALTVVSFLLAIFSTVVLLMYLRNAAKHQPAEAAWREHEENFRRTAPPTTPIEEAAGQAEAGEGATSDIGERPRVDEALRQSEERYRTLIERMPDGVYRSTPEGEYVEVNPALVKILGYDSIEELLSVDIKTRIYFDPAERSANGRFSPPGSRTATASLSSAIAAKTARKFGWKITANLLPIATAK